MSRWARSPVGGGALLVGLALIAGACTGDAAKSDSAGDDTGQWYPAEGGEVTLTTRDGVDLVADYLPAEAAGAPGIVLLHMIPPANDRSTWPDSFLQDLHAAGYSVLVPDRRGAGESGGVARDAYEGEYGRYDVEACALKLAEDGAGALVLIGASNGTTSALDYALWAGGEGLPEPAALGFMTGGSYTENNNAMDGLSALPAVFTFSTEERSWSVDQETLPAAGGWSFLEYSDGAHGTLMFDAAPEVGADILGWLDAIL